MHYVGHVAVATGLRLDAYRRRQLELQARLGRQLQVLLAGCGHDRPCDSSDHRSDGRALTPVGDRADDGPQTGAAADLACRAPALTLAVCDGVLGDDLGFTRSQTRSSSASRAIWSLPFKVPDCLTLATWITTAAPREIASAPDVDYRRSGRRRGH